MEVKKARLTRLQNRINHQSMLIGRAMLGPPAHPGGGALQDGIPCSCVAAPRTTGWSTSKAAHPDRRFADVEITGRASQLLRGNFIAARDEMNLRIATAPSEILARRPDNVPDELGGRPSDPIDPLSPPPGGGEPMKRIF